MNHKTNITARNVLRNQFDYHILFDAFTVEMGTAWLENRTQITSNQTKMHQPKKKKLIRPFAIRITRERVVRQRELHFLTYFGRMCRVSYNVVFLSFVLNLFFVLLSSITCVWSVYVRIYVSVL